MAIFERKSRIGVPVKELFAWHNRPNVFERLTPPWEKIKIIEKKGGIRDGSRMVLEIRQGPFHRRWVAVHSDYIEGQQFCDEQVQGPFSKWIHTHKFLPESETTSLLEDHIEYKAPMGFLGGLIAGKYIAKNLEHVFAFRHARTQNDLARFHPFAQQRPLKIVISGSTGLIGTALRNFLSCAGHRILTLVRRPPNLDGPEIFWDPTRGELDKNSLESTDVVIHLAGENIGDGKWSPRRKAAIRDSRIEGTRFLSEILASLRHPPKVLISSSAVGFYGNRGDEMLTEESPCGTGFLAETCQAWENAAEPARKAGIRVVHPRIGIVLSPAGGALGKMLFPFKMGFGGPIGSGAQWMSWIAMEDLMGIFYHLIFSEKISGPVNVTSPWPVTNRAFTKTLGGVLGRPTPFPLPVFGVRLLFGEMGETLLLEGQKVKPQKLMDAGFPFLYPELESALRWELGK